MYIPLVLTDSLGRFPNEVSIGNIRYRTPNAKSLSFTSSYLFPFPTYLPCLIYFLVKRKHLRKREAYGWRPLADSSIGRPSPGSLTGENHPSEKHRSSACSFTSKDLRSGPWEKSSGNAHWRETEDISSFSTRTVVSNFCDPTDCSPPGSSVQGIPQARVLERVAISSFRGTS